MSKMSLLSLICEIINEKIQLDNKYDVMERFHLNLDDFFMKYFKEKFKLSKIVKKNCQQSLISFIKHSPDDFRIDNFRKFLGVGSQRTRTEIVAGYFSLLKNLPMSFYRMYDEIEISNSFMISLDICNEIFEKKFENHTINLETYEKILRASEYYKNDKLEHSLPLETRKDIFFLQKYIKKFRENFDDLFYKPKKPVEEVVEKETEIKDSNKNKEEENLNVFIVPVTDGKVNYLGIAKDIMLANQDYNLTLEYVIEIFQRYFNYEDYKIELEKFRIFFNDKYLIKIKTLEFTQITLETFYEIYTDLDRKIMIILNDILEIKARGIILFREFELVLYKIFGNNENKWKNMEYFK
jgi:hypothetical protein